MLCIYLSTVCVNVEVTIVLFELKEIAYQLRQTARKLTLILLTRGVADSRPRDPTYYNYAIPYPLPTKRVANTWNAYGKGIWL